MEDLDFELAANQAGKDLPAPLFDAFHTLAFELEAHRGRWGLFLLKFNHRSAQTQVSPAIAQFFGRVSQIDPRPFASWSELESALIQAAPNCDAIELTELDEWLSPPDRAEPEQARAKLLAWNIHRRNYADQVKVPVLCWLRVENLRLFARTAPDLWSWRVGMYDFAVEVESQQELRTLQPHLDVFDNRSVATRMLRIREIEHYLQVGEPSEQMTIQLLHELVNLHINIAELDTAMRILKERLLPLAQRTGYEQAIAYTYGKIAHIFQLQGQFDAALQIYEGKLLPSLKELDDVLGIAVTQGRIADIRQIRGELDLALRIRHDEQLPVYEKLGNNRARAITLAKIADIHIERKDFDLALRIVQDEALPIFEKLGDLRECANIQGKIAGILMARGELDAALRIYQQVELPIYEKLGDLRSRALTFGDIASIFETRGNLDAALQLRQNEELPVYQTMSAKREIAFCQCKIAAILVKRNAPSDLSQAEKLLQNAINIAQEMNIPEQDRIQKNLDYVKQRQQQKSSL